MTIRRRSRWTKYYNCDPECGAADDGRFGKVAWDAIVSGKSNVAVGPPGVGATSISNLVKSILTNTGRKVCGKNHETLIQMEDELKATLASGTKIVVRVERTRSTDEVTLACELR